MATLLSTGDSHFHPSTSNPKISGSSDHNRRRSPSCTSQALLMQLSQSRERCFLIQPAWETSASTLTRKLVSCPIHSRSPVRLSRHAGCFTQCRDRVNLIVSIRRISSTIAVLALASLISALRHRRRSLDASCSFPCGVATPSRRSSVGRIEHTYSAEGRMDAVPVRRARLAAVTASDAVSGRSSFSHSSKFAGNRCLILSKPSFIIQLI